MKKFNYLFIVLLLSTSHYIIAAQTSPEIIFPNELNGTVILKNFLHKEKTDNEILSVFVINQKEEYESNAIQGKYTRVNNSLIFHPYFPFENGLTYVVRTKDTNFNSTYSYQSFQIGNQEAVEEARVVSTYPLSDKLPENILRFYIYFNTPMKKGQALNHIKLIDEDGNIDNNAFMKFKQELWSADGKRLTILFDPGRIKRGVSTNISRGPVLIEGKKYKLSISGTWQDIHGKQLIINTLKEFMVVNSYRQHIRINDWGLDLPKANTNDSLTLKFDRIMDHALIQSMIKLEDEENNIIPGYWEILETEQSIQFIPEKNWKQANYRIVIDSRLEDVAGNNLQNLLDHIKMDEESNSDNHQYIKFKI